MQTQPHNSSAITGYWTRSYGASADRDRAQRREVMELRRSERKAKRQQLMVRLVTPKPRLSYRRAVRPQPMENLLIGQSPHRPVRSASGHFVGV